MWRYVYRGTCTHILIRILFCSRYPRLVLHATPPEQTRTLVIETVHCHGAVLFYVIAQSGRGTTLYPDPR